MCASSLSAQAPQNPNGACIECHRQVHDVCKNSEKGSMHFYANRPLGGAEDSAVWASPAFKEFNSEFRFFKDAELFKVEVSEGGKKSVYDAEMAIGVSPLVQYAVKFPRGAYQILSASYDVNKKEFFDVFGEERKAGEWGHWSGRGMNWNSNCAYCHMTDFKKNYDYKTDSYSSAWKDSGITCLQCHSALPESCRKADPSAPAFKGRPGAQARMEACASCHSRREQITPDAFRLGDSYFDHFRPILPDTPGIYYADGQVLGENFMYGSFMMSRQHLAGVVCADCHDAHSLKFAAVPYNNKLCLNCHAPEARGIKGAPTIDVKAHTFHDERGGDKCMECHMPRTNYMQRDARYDHGFTSPDPYLTKAIQVPNACTSCHTQLDKDKPERTLDWMIEKYSERHLTERLLRKRSRAVAVHRAHEGGFDAQHMQTLLHLAKTEEIPAWRAILTSLLAPYASQPQTFEELKKYLKDPSPLVRSAALRALAPLDAARADLQPMLKDPSRLVRVDASCVFLKESPRENFDELLAYLNFNTDAPAGALRRADLALNTDDIEGADFFARHAQTLDHGSSDVKIEAARIMFSAGKLEEAKNMYAQAQALDPKNPRAWYDCALVLAAVNDLEGAVKNLEECVKVAPAFSRAWYNLSVAKIRNSDFEGAALAADSALALEPENQEYISLKRYILSQRKK